MFVCTFYVCLVLSFLTMVQIRIHVTIHSYGSPDQYVAVKA